MRTVNDRRSPLAIVCIGSEQVANMEKSRSGSVKTNLEPATAGENAKNRKKKHFYKLSLNTRTFNSVQMGDVILHMYIHMYFVSEFSERAPT
jgi:hypothetical protein